MKKRMKLAMLACTASLAITNFSVQASDTYVLKNVPSGDEDKQRIYEVLSKYTFPNILNPTNQQKFKDKYKSKAIIDTYKTKSTEFAFVTQALKDIAPSIEIIPMTKSLYELIAYTYLVENNKLSIKGKEIMYNGKKQKPITTTFNPEYAFNEDTKDDEKTITAGCANLAQMLKNTFWLVNDYAQQYIDKEDALDTLLKKFNKREIDQKIHEAQGAHSLLIAALQQDPNYQYGCSPELDKSSDEYKQMIKTARDELGEKWNNLYCRRAALLIVNDKFNDYNKTHKAKNKHYETQKQLSDAATMAYKFITNMINYEKASDKYILYRSGDDLPDYATHISRTICYSDGLFAGMLDDGGCALDISWSKRMQNADGKSYLQRVELDRTELLEGKVPVFIPPMPPLGATVGIGEVHHVRSKVLVVPEKKHTVYRNDGSPLTDDAPDLQALDIAESNFLYFPEDNPEYYLPHPAKLKYKTNRSIDDKGWREAATQIKNKNEQYEMIKKLCNDTKFVNKDGSDYVK